MCHFACIILNMIWWYFKFSKIEDTDKAKLLWIRCYKIYYMYEHSMQLINNLLQILKNVNSRCFLRHFKINSKYFHLVSNIKKQVHKSITNYTNVKWVHIWHDTDTYGCTMKNKVPMLHRYILNFHNIFYQSFLFFLNTISMYSVWYS